MFGGIEIDGKFLLHRIGIEIVCAPVRIRNGESGPEEAGIR